MDGTIAFRPRPLLILVLHDFASRQDAKAQKEANFLAFLAALRELRELLNLEIRCSFWPK